MPQVVRLPTIENQSKETAVQSNMSQFADNRSLIFAAKFPNQPITMGGEYTI
jgi:hypothetical protein